MRAALPERANAANREAQHCRGCAGTPEDLAAEGKTILTPGRKSADELERQLRQPSHRRSMPQYAHACSEDMGGQDVRPKANPRKIIHSPGEKDHDCFHVVFRVVAVIKMRNVAKQNAACLLSAICHLSKLPTEREMPPLCLINMFEENHESTKQLARNSSVCQSHCRDFGAFLDACIRRALGGAALRSSTELLF